MSEMERLYLLSGLTPTEILNAFRNRYYTEGNNTENGIVANAINEILPRMTLLPRKVGDVVYFVLDDEAVEGGWFISEEHVIDVGVRGFMISQFATPRSDDPGHLIHWDRVGIECFFDKDEAEKALAERRNLR